VNCNKAIVALTPPAHVGATTPDEGSIGDSSPPGTCRRAIRYPIPMARQRRDGVRSQLAPGAHQAVYVAVPFHDPDALLGRVSGAGAEAEFQRAFEATTRDWRRLLSCVDFSVRPRPATCCRLRRARSHTS
jgi:hypothetical protein